MKTLPKYFRSYPHTDIAILRAIREKEESEERLIKHCKCIVRHLVAIWFDFKGIIREF